MIRLHKPLTYLLILAIISCSSPDKNSGKALDQQEVSLNDAIQILPDTLAEAPYLFTDQRGEVYLSWTQSFEDESLLKFSRLLSDDTWSKPDVIARGNDWFVNWADYPVMAVNKDQMMASYLVKSSDSTYSYDILLTSSADRGQSWSDSQILHNDGSHTEHGFVSMIPYGDNFFVTWLDGRNTTNLVGEGERGAMTLRAAVIDLEENKLEEWGLDQRVCDCCQTSACITASGPVVVYRDRSEAEVRDIYIVRHIDGSWTSPKPVHNDNWQINGCPVNGPGISAIGNSVAIGWFTVIQDTARVNLTFSSDGGVTFSEPFRIDKGNTIGRIDVELISEKRALISWMEGDDILLALVSSTGEITGRNIIASSSYSRSSGFPQITLTGTGRIAVAWTDSELGRIKTRLLNLDFESSTQ